MALEKGSIDEGNRLVVGAVLACALAAPATAQFHDVIFTVEHGQGWHAVDTTVAASPTRVVVATNHRLELRNGDGSLRLDPSHNPPVPQSFVVGSPSFPFELSKPTATWRDTRADYDSANDRLWVIYWEGESVLHIAVSKDNSSPDTWDDFHYFTGSDAIDLGSSAILPADWRVNLADHPIINIDESFLHISVMDNVPLSFERRDAIASIPLSHSAGSMLSGARPPESDIDLKQLRLLPAPMTDHSVLHYPVQEPHEQFTGVQFFICTSQGPKYGADPTFAPPPLHYDGVHTQIRLAARYFDSGAWKWIFHDMDIDSSSPSPDHFFNPMVETPDTPKSGWGIATIASHFESAVLARNLADGAWRVFAGHNVVVSSQGEGPLAPIDKTEFRYYVIDPDIAGFPGSWTPSIEVVGRAPTGNITNPHTYTGAIAVNDQGIAYITFTRSGTQSPAGWPSLVRARLTSDYTAIQYEVAAAFAQGPKAWYANPSGVPDGDLGSDYADMQADPDGCNFWAIGTIVAYIDHEPEPAVPHTKRAIWLTEILACNTNAEMNGDGVVDMEDYNLYLDHYMKETPQADMDGDGKVDSLDYLKYSDEYAKR